MKAAFAGYGSVDIKPSHVTFPNIRRAVTNAIVPTKAFVASISRSAAASVRRLKYVGLAVLPLLSACGNMPLDQQIGNLVGSPSCGMAAIRDAISHPSGVADPLLTERYDACMGRPMNYGGPMQPQPYNPNFGGFGAGIGGRGVTLSR